MILVIWILCGVVGAVLMWLCSRWEKEYERRRYNATGRPDPQYDWYWCPTPKQILAGVGISLLGFCGFLVGLVFVIANFAQHYPMPGKTSWWTRPICDR